MIHVRARKPDGSIIREARTNQLHDLHEDPKNLIWVDLDDPTPDEIGLVAGSLNWTHLTVEHLISKDERAKIEPFDGYTVIVMNDLLFQQTPSGGKARLSTPEVDWIIGSNYVASVHYHNPLYVMEAREGEQFIQAFLSKGAD